MSQPPILRDWFLEGDGILREVVSADIQSFLGNDATVRPGKKEVKGREVKGYWIKAYRNLTTPMVEDLKAKSIKWESETKSGRRVKYEDSRTFQETARPLAAGNNSPRPQDPYSSASRIGRDPRDQEMPDYMDTRPDHRDSYTRTPSHVPVVTSPYGEHVVYAGDRPPLPPVEYMQQGDHPMVMAGYTDVGIPVQGRGNVAYPSGYSGTYGQPGMRDDPRYPVARDDIRYIQTEDPRHPADPRYIDPRQPPRGDTSRRPDDPRYHPMEGPRYSQSREDVRYVSTREDPRYQASRDDPRYQQSPARDDPRYQRAGYQDASPRYAYPSSSATTSSSVPGHEQDPKVPAQPTSYAQPATYNQYGRPYPPSQGSQVPDPTFQPPPSRMESHHSGSHSNSGRKRAAGSSDGDSHRRSHR